MCPTLSSLGRNIVETQPIKAGMQDQLDSAPGQRTKIPRAVEQLSPQATARESVSRSEDTHILQPRPSAAK